jgi:hypothetical protein
MSYRILPWKYLASKCASLGRTRNPSGDQNMVTIRFGLPIIFLGIVGGATYEGVHIDS